MARRTVKIRKTQPANKVKTRQDRLHENSISGGQRDVIGFTAGLADATDLEKMQKGIYGLFEGGGNPHYQVIYGNIMDSQGNWRVIEPIYAYRDLLKILACSTILRQCIDAYVTNIESYGMELEYVGPDGEQDSRAARNEKARIWRVLGTLTSDGRSLTQHRERSRFDKETLGARCFEIIRDAAGRVVGFDHVETCSIKPTSKDKVFTQSIVTDPMTGTSKAVERRFRRYLQVTEEGRKVWFKEYGDPRSINPETGEVDNSLEIEDQATELYYDSIYTPGTPVGVPRWAGAIPALLGSREAEMVNLNFFRDNAIPALAVLVSGGALTEESFEKIDQYITGVRGASSMNRIVVMEAVSDGAEAAAIDGSLPAPKVDIKPMLSERQHEGLFQNYIGDAERKVRETFRLPPVYVGSAEEYNRASAFASIMTAEQQVFIPERKAWDYMFDRVVLSTHNLRYWKVRSAGPGMQDPAEVARVVNSLGREGALTPNIAVKLANRYLDADIPIITDEWGDVPFNVIMSYIDQGDTIPGLDIFEERVNEAVENDPLLVEQEEEEDGTRALTGTSKSLRRLLNKVYGKMQHQLDDAVQSIVASRDNA